MPNKLNVDAWLEIQIEHNRQTLENTSRYFDKNDSLTVNTLEAIYGRESSFGTMLGKIGDSPHYIKNPPQVIKHPNWSMLITQSCFYKNQPYLQLCPLDRTGLKLKLLKSEHVTKYNQRGFGQSL